MELVVNGTSHVLPEGATVSELVGDLGFGERTVVVELNGEALERSRYAEVRLREGDRVEVVRAVAGG